MTIGISTYRYKRPPPANDDGPGNSPPAVSSDPRKSAIVTVRNRKAQRQQ